jgi:Na+-transporting NADH:ubiquinone oxidoreductase subunit C
VDKNSIGYVFGFAAIVTLTVAVSLSLTSQSLAPLKAANELTYKKKDILSGVMPEVKTMSNEDVAAAFEEYVEQVTINSKGEIVENSAVAPIDIDVKKEKKKEVESQNLPLFIVNIKGDKNYILPVRGNGLWDEIWGFITLEADGNTIKGVAFDHKGETPGLGAEIKDNKNWKEQFVGTKLFEGDEFVGVDVVKGGVKKPDHQIDGISGATITGVGVAAMIKNDIAKYVAYIEKNVKQ